MCSDRDKHVFWDPYHPSEASNLIIAKQLLDGDTKVISPMNLRQLRNHWFLFSWNSLCVPPFAPSISFELHPLSCLKYFSLIKCMFIRFFISKDFALSSSSYFFSFFSCIIFFGFVCKLKLMRKVKGIYSTYVVKNISLRVMNVHACTLYI